MCPPLARELAINLKLNSLTFQRLFFLCIMRRIWPVNDLAIKTPFEEKALAIFSQNQMSFRRQTLGQHQNQTEGQTPVLRAKTISSPLYIFQDGFMRRPERPSNPSLSVEKWNFTVCREDMNRLPRSNCAGGEVAREIDQNSKLIRLRCIKWGKPEDPSDAAWAAADTKWIPRSYFSLNGHHLEQRKKLHHGKDMPIDITDLVTEGENTLEFTVLTSINDTAHHAYSIGVETVGVATHDSIRGQVTNQNYVPSEKVLAAIQDQLSKSTNDDDDIAVVSDSTLTITLFDPFYQSRFCDIPVRAKSCLHNNCFDLETFLSTRTRKADASVADQWRCPICRGDARPHTLLVDGFVKEICEDLPKRGLGG
ncbi:hypothetical protein PtrCC142_003309 [Pyrenophora tritici-repentis]|nr:hypothetical protein PtrCC142_003309 [Pyrenophora tritici-repentis]